MTRGFWCLVSAVKIRRCSCTDEIAICLNPPFVLMEVCLVDILVACLRISAQAFKVNSFRETHLCEYFGETDKIALITTCPNNFNASSSCLKD